MTRNLNNSAVQTPGRRYRTVAAALAIALFVALRPALSAPVVQQVSGTLDHKGTITIGGSGFGSKPTAAPLVWDDASGNNVLEKWDGAWPYQLPGYNMGYYQPIRGINPPHSHDTRYLAGAHAGHAETATAYGGFDVVVFKNITPQGSPNYIYASWYQRADPNWVFTTQFPHNNYKTFAYSLCCSPYENPYDWMIIYGPGGLESAQDSGTQWLIGSNDHTMQNPDARGHIAWWNHAENPMKGWTKLEVAAKLTPQSDGYVKMWENGHQVIDYAGSTDNSTWSSNRRTVGIGGYTYPYGHPENWRYFADAYLDTTLSRVVIANNATLSNATIIENQIPSQWSDTSIKVTVNLGHFSPGQTAYLFVVDSSGTPSATGMPVTAGGTSTAAPMPNAPTAVGVK